MPRAERSTPKGKEQGFSLEKWNKTPKRDQSEHGSSFASSQTAFLNRWYLHLRCQETPKGNNAKIETSFNPGGNILAYNVKKCCFCDKKKYSP